MKPVLKFITAVLNIIFSCFKLLPVKNKITFISRQSDSKSEDMIMLEDALRDRLPDIKMVFLCKKLEGGIFRKICYCFHMLRQMYHIATSQVVILDSYCISISVLKQRESLVVIQMWHALGALKKFGLSIVGSGEGRDRTVAEALSMHRNYTWVLTSGDACVPYFAEAFGYKENRVKVMPLPRVDKLTDTRLKSDNLRKIYTRYPEFKGKKLVVYAPTFRKDRDISAETDLLASKLDPSAYAFVLKKHPLMTTSCHVAAVDDEFTTLEMLFAADYVVCDYSAVVFEAAVLCKPIFFYNFDYDEYGEARDFYIDYMAEMPGVISKSADEIAEAIVNERYDIGRVKEFASKYVSCQQGCSRRIAEFVAEIIR